VIHYQDGTTAQIAGKFLTWDGGHAALSDITVAPLTHALPLDVTAIRPPVMYAAITIAGETRNAAIPLADYQVLAINSARSRAALAPPSAVVQRSVKLAASALSTIGQTARRVCGACSKR